MSLSVKDFNTVTSDSNKFSFENTEKVKIYKLNYLAADK